MIHEIASSPHYSADPPRIRREWSLRDIVTATRILDWHAATAPDGTTDGHNAP